MKALTIISIIILTNISLGWASETPPEASSWPKQMQKMSQSINELIPFIYSQKAFHDESNQAKIEKAIVSLKEAIHKVPVKGNENVAGKDPIVNSSLTQLESDLDQAKLNFTEGNVEYARVLIQGAIHHCFRCHSRSQFGPEFFKSPTDINEVSLTLTEQADLYVATRQYAKAMSALEKKLTLPRKIFEGQYEMEQALKKYLAIAVRIKKDPNRAIKTIGKLLEQEGIPFYLREDMAQWVTSLMTWESNLSQKPSMASAKALIDAGNKIQDEFGFQRGYIEFLRGSSILHDLLRSTNLKKSEYAEIYLSLGQSYEIIYSLGLWELPEIYYEDCVRQSPKSDIAKRCYKHFERNTFLAYTGSAGTFIPEDQRRLLKELCNLAGIEHSCYASF